MAVLVCLSGCFRIISAGETLPLPLRGPTLDLFCYLLLHAGKDIRREKLGALLWPDRPEASTRTLLSTALWRVRKAAAGVPGISLQSSAGTVRLDTGPGTEIDALRLRDALRSAQASPGDTASQAGLSAALGADDGDFMEGADSDWVLAERERQFNTRVQALTFLLNAASGARCFEEAAGFARRVLALDPYRECAVRQLMWIYVESGQPARAIRQFAAYEALLRSELDLTPLPETVALRDHIRQGGMEPARLASSLAEAAHGREALRDALAARAQ
jgi:DNA-binding SARP family transcriptional activator